MVADLPRDRGLHHTAGAISGLEFSEKSSPGVSAWGYTNLRITDQVMFAIAGVARMFRLEY